MNEASATPYTDYLTQRLAPALWAFVTEHVRYTAAKDQAEAEIERTLREMQPGIGRSERPYVKDALRTSETFTAGTNALRPAWEAAYGDFEKAWQDGHAISETATEDDLASGRDERSALAEGNYRLTLTKASQDWIGVAVIAVLTGATFDEAANVQKSIQYVGPSEVLSGVSLDSAVDLKRVLEAMEGFAVSIAEGPPPGRYKRQAIPESVRHEVWRRDGGACVDCGSRERLEFDHIVPVSKGGANTARNIELRCESCNRKKAAKI